MFTPTDQLAKLQEAYKARTKQQQQSGNVLQRVLFLGPPADQRYAATLKTWCVEHRVLASFKFDNTLTLAAINSLIQQETASTYPYTFCVLSNSALFERLADGALRKQGSLRDYRGSVIPPELSGICIPIVITLSLLDAQGRPAVHTSPTFKWILESDLGKVLSYTGPYRYRYTILPQDHAAYDTAYRYAQSAAITVGDIETNLGNIITVNGFTHIGADLTIGHTFVADLRRTWATGNTLPYEYVRKVYSQTDAIKCFHNGCFDTFHLFRHRIPVSNWLFDTEYMWHSWESELLKSLAFVASIALPDYIYWKAEAEENLLEYNAKDCINTARVLVWLLRNMPDWAWKVYGQMLPVLWPIVFSSLEGFATDKAILYAAKEKHTKIAADALAELRAITAQPELSANSPKQLEAILYGHLGKVFGWTRPLTAGNKKKAQKSGKLPSCTDATTLRIIQQSHPLAARIVGVLLRYRAASKAKATYFDTPLYGTFQRLYYSFAPDGTSTGRLSCSASSLRLVTGCSPKDGTIRKSDIANYGNQIQNAPKYYKKALCADPGYQLFNIDKSKSEAHCVALVSGDKAFKEALEDTSLDFYLRLAEWFFGIVTNNNKELPIRQVTKKINHASSYCMGWETFFDQVGMSELLRFMDLVNWQGPRDARAFISYLLGLYHDTFKDIKRVLWLGTTEQLIKYNGYLPSPDGSVRHFHKVPSSPKALMPNAVAHVPQRLSVMTLNRAMVQVFYELQIPTQFALRLKGQVHDSLVGQVLDTRLDLIDKVREIMERPYETSLGTLNIPCDVTGPTSHWG